MKAKEYAKMFKENPSLETLKKIAQGYLDECKELLISRHAQTDSAAIAIFREQDQKWKALCYLVEGLKPEGFRILVCEQWPEIGAGMGWQSNTGSRRQGNSEPG
jgi:hypothetical protein